MRIILVLVSLFYILYYNIFLSVTISSVAVNQLSNDPIVYGLSSAAASGGGLYSKVYAFCILVVLYYVVKHLFNKLKVKLNAKEYF